MKKATTILALLLIPCLLLTGCNRSEGGSTTAATTEAPAFEVRRPSAEQDALFSMERVTDAHYLTNWGYFGYNSFNDFITHADNPLRKPTLMRVSILGEDVGTKMNEDLHAYITEIQCRVEEIYYIPSGINLEVGSTNINIIDYRGIEDGKMWYYKGDLPTLDCYEYYIIGYLSEYKDQYTFNSDVTEVVPVVDCYEQYEETMNHYGFDMMDCNSIYSNALYLLQDYIAGCKYWLEDAEKLQILKNRLAEDDNDRYWQTIVDEDREDLITQELADPIMPGGSVREIIELLGKPQSLTTSGGNGIIYYLTDDGSKTMEFYYDYMDPSETVTVIKRNYILEADPANAQKVQVGMTYDQVVEIMGVPGYIRNTNTNEFEPCMEYVLTEYAYALFYLDFSQPQPIVTSIWIQ